MAALAAVTAIASAVLWPGVPAYADKVRNAQWHIKFLDLAEAQRITKGAGVKVAVIDTGVAPHPDLRGNLKKGIDVASGRGNGQTDADGHGTSMAGIIAGRGQGPNDGVLGIAPEAEILPIKAMGAVKQGGDFQGDEVAEGIAWGVKLGAGVINASLAGTPSRPLNEAIAQAVEADTLIVAAAGNKTDVLIFAYPAALPDVLAVGAIDKNGKLAKFSRTGEKVALCAPGADVASTGLNGGYLLNNGTSAATAVVSGAAALVRAKFPGLSAKEVAHRLTATADDYGTPGKDEECGYGVLNVVKALTADVPPLTATAAPSTGGSAPAVDGSAAPSTPPVTNEAAPEAKSSNSVLGPVAGIGVAVVALIALIAFGVARIRRRDARR
ncbi:type VII secretion-associated serine protease mycosin [Actinoplanes couchii]|uniref:Type VII secretion-associated serine protease n=1 Tax=Actinoplanes couchii TaxID=403638 RepID=A0ABQ3X6N0_9ACTN|nr:type VII secretion-associated serine protease [Actinoplanes couchii]